MRRICVVFLVLFFGLASAVAAYSEEAYTSTWCYANERNPADDMTVGNASIAPSRVFENGLRLRASSGDNLAATIYLFGVDARAKALKITVEVGSSSGDVPEGQLIVVNVANSYSDEVLGSRFDIVGSGKKTFYVYPADEHINKEDLVELHITASDGQDMDIGSVQVDSLRQRPTYITVRTYEHFPRRRWTIADYIYRGPIFIVGSSPYQYSAYYGWWWDPVYLKWRKVYYGTLVRAYPRWPYWPYYYVRPAWTTVRYVVARPYKEVVFVGRGGHHSHGHTRVRCSVKTRMLVRHRDSWADSASWRGGQGKGNIMAPSRSGDVTAVKTRRTDHSSVRQQWQAQGSESRQERARRWDEIRGRAASVQVDETDVRRGTQGTMKTRREVARQTTGDVRRGQSTAIAQDDSREVTAAPSRLDSRGRKVIQPRGTRSDGSSSVRSGERIVQTKTRSSSTDVRRGPATTDTTRSGSGSVKIRRETVRTVESRRVPSREVGGVMTRSSSSESPVKVRRESARKNPQPVQAPSRQQVKDDDDDDEKRGSSSSSGSKRRSTSSRSVTRRR